MEAKAAFPQQVWGFKALRLGLWGFMIFPLRVQLAGGSVQGFCSGYSAFGLRLEKLSRLSHPEMAMNLSAVEATTQLSANSRGGGSLEACSGGMFGGHEP